MMTRNAVAALDFSVRPADQGQIVEVAYAADWENEVLVRRVTDRSDGSVVFACATIKDGKFEPWNGVLPDHGEWASIS